MPQTPVDNPVREAYRLWNDALSAGRSSWDQIAVLAAVVVGAFACSQSTARDGGEAVDGRDDVDEPGRGVDGVATSKSDTNYGVFGESRSVSGRGVFGYGNAASGAS